MTDEEHQRMAAAQAERMSDVRAAEQLALQAAARAELAADLEALRGLGVKTFRGSGIEVEFFPPEPTAAVEVKASKPSDSPDMCKCGHPLFAHVNGGCVEGCNDEQCRPQQK